MSKTVPLRLEVLLLVDKRMDLRAFVGRLLGFLTNEGEIKKQEPIRIQTRDDRAWSDWRDVDYAHRDA